MLVSFFGSRKLCKLGRVESDSGRCGLILRDEEPLHRKQEAFIGRDRVAPLGRNECREIADLENRGSPVLGKRLTAETELKRASSQRHAAWAMVWVPLESDV